MKEQELIKVKSVGNKSVLDHLLKQWGLSYKEFSDYLKISDVTLRQYRKGKREFKLNWQQIQTLEKLLNQVGLTFQSLDSDWIKDQDDSSDSFFDI